MDEQPGGIAPAAYWENRYSDAGHIWSGAPNRTTADVVSTLTPGRVLDLGCGEGADVVWFAQRGWVATGLDLSPTAVARAADAAAAAGLTAEQARFTSTDLSTWRSAATYDLVTASFFHSPVALTRTVILRRAAGSVAPGGHLLIVSHLSFPSGIVSGAHAHPDPASDPQFLSPAEEIAALDLPPDEWATVLAETRTRAPSGPASSGTTAIGHAATGPDAGEHLTLDDGVVLLRRL